MIKINGVNIDKNELPLMQYLNENGILPQHVAVELNLEILPKSSLDSVILKEGDVVEIVQFVGGGC